MELYFFIWLALASVPGILASNKGRNFFGYFALGIFLTPLVSFIVVLCLKDLEKEEMRNMIRNIESNTVTYPQNDILLPSFAKEYVHDAIAECRMVLCIALHADWKFTDYII